MTLICHSCLSSSVSIFSTLLPLILEYLFLSLAQSLPRVRGIYQLSIVPHCHIDILGWLFSNKEGFCLSVRMVGHVHMYKQIDGHFCQS